MHDKHNLETRELKTFAFEGITSINSNDSPLINGLASIRKKSFEFLKFASHFDRETTFGNNNFLNTKINICSHFSQTKI